MAAPKKPTKVNSEKGTGAPVMRGLLNVEELWDYALRAIGRRAHSSGEIREKLMRRSRSSADVNATMAKLREYGFADDTRFSEVFAGSRLQNQSFGRFRVLQELRIKRVAPEVAKKAVEKVFAGTNETELIETYLQKKFRGRDLRDLLQEEKQLASAYRRLRAAGFSSANSIQVLKRYSRAAEECEEPEDDNISC